MKKLFLLIAFATLGATAANAQSGRSHDYKYQGEINFGYTIGTSGGYDRTNIRTVHGFRFNEYVFAGIGTGIDIYQDVDHDDDGSSETKTRLTLPVYINAKGYYPITDRFEIFLGFDFGYSMPLSRKKDNTLVGTTLKGRFFMPELGFGYRLNYGHTITLGIGYSMNNYKKYMEYAGITTQYNDIYHNNGMSLRIGYVF